MSQMFRLNLRILVSIYAFYITISATVYAQDEVILQRLQGPITLDGFSNEQAWEHIKPLPLTMFTPTFRGRPTERTEIRVAYDDRYIYLSGRLYDSDPSGIQGYSLLRDADRGGDFLNFIIDTFNDNENAVGVMTTPTGSRIDVEFRNDSEGADWQNPDWNTYWDTRVVQNSEGWFVESRIPFTSLRFQSDSGRVVFGIIVHRLIARKNERLTYPAIQPKWSNAQWKASLAQDVVLQGISFKKPLYITPFVSGGIERKQLPGPDNKEFKKDENLRRELGLDVKYGLSQNSTLDLTLNTDFAQVEADDERLNLTRFSLFFPEKRQFFQERSSAFVFKTGDVSRLFHSRKIGLTEDGLPIRILGGVRLVTRTGNWDIAALNMQTAENDSIPTENLGAYRLKRRVLNQFSYVGGMITNRVDRDGNYNINVGFDGVFRVFGSDYLSLNYVNSFEDNRNSGFPDASLARIHWQRRSAKGLAYQLDLSHVGSAYNPRLGFIFQNNVYRFSGDLNYTQFTNENSATRRYTIGANNSLVLRKADKRIESNRLTSFLEIERKSSTKWVFEFSTFYENLLEPFSPISETVKVPAGKYTYHSIASNLQMTTGRRLRANMKADFGSFYDGTRLSLTVSPTWIQSRYFEISAEYEFNRLNFDKRSQLLNANLWRLRLQGAANTKFSSRALIQYNSIDDKIGVNTQIRYNFREGHDFYLVYNELLNSDRNKNGFMLPVSENRTFLFKYIYTFMR